LNYVLKKGGPRWGAASGACGERAECEAVTPWIQSGENFSPREAYRKGAVVCNECGWPAGKFPGMQASRTGVAVFNYALLPLSFIAAAAKFPFAEGHLLFV
jgi:hypothetical protein